MGSATALCLARRNVRVTLFDAAHQPFAGASRWNEGKIHLGYLYAGDPSLDTARRLLPGGLAFKRLTEELVGCSIDGATTEQDETFLIHRNSVVPPDAAARYFDAVTAMAAGHPEARGYLAPLTHARSTRLSEAALEATCDTAHVVAGFRVPERSVYTPWLADRFVDALSSEPRIEHRMQSRVVGVRRTTGTLAPPLFIETSVGVDGPFDAVVNALWEGRLAIDVALGLPTPSIWSHRFRLSAFLRAVRTVEVPSTVVVTGPFGDVKNYGGRDFYLSWYLTGLRAEGSGVAPPPVTMLDTGAQTRVAVEIIERLGEVVPSVMALRDCVADVRLEGGWVYAEGRGSLADPTSTLHRRDRVGITRTGAYFSVDTGKYSIAPWLASEVAHLIV